MADPIRDLDFEAFEVHSDGGLGRARYRFVGAPDRGWTVEREGATQLRLGEGYELLETEVCGVCSTDLDRHLLPFPLPQIAGHELIGVDAAGRRFAPEINATPKSLGQRAGCPDCADGLERHCPSRLVLGIHDLPGGFGPRVLAPKGALVEVPRAVPTETAVLVEPFAAALRAVERIDFGPGDGDRIRSVAVLGPKKLGMLVLAALASERRIQGRGFSITALLRREDLRETALAVGADDVVLVGDGEGGAATSRRFDLVVDTTGNPAGFDLALQFADKEVHLKSTNGQSAGGLQNATALVVDELSIEPLDSGRLRARADCGPIAWLSASEPPEDLAVVRIDSPDELLSAFPPRPGGCLGGAPTVVVDRLGQADLVIRPSEGDEIPGIRPTGVLMLAGGSADESPAPTLEQAVLQRGLRLGSSRCGDFRRAFERMEADVKLQELGERLVTGRRSADQLPEAFEDARSRRHLKVLVEHRR